MLLFIIRSVIVLTLFFATVMVIKNTNPDLVSTEIDLPDIEKTEWEIFKSATLDSCLKLKADLKMDNITLLRLYDSVMKTFYQESKFCENCVSKVSTAKGIIQFLKSTRQKYGIPENIDKMRPIEQLPYVMKYIRGTMKYHKIRGEDIMQFIDVYCIVFAPSKVSAGMDEKFYCNCGRGKKCKGCPYHSNKGYDLNKDGCLTKREIQTKILLKFK